MNDPVWIPALYRGDLRAASNLSGVRLELDALSSLLMNNSLQAAFLYWAWVDIELDRAYAKVKKERPPIRFKDKLNALFDGASGRQEAIRTKILARRKHRDEMVHGSRTPKDDEASNDFWLCWELVHYLKSKSSKADSGASNSKMPS
jgi:hypothetical protein